MQITLSPEIQQIELGIRIRAGAEFLYSNILPIDAYEKPHLTQHLHALTCLSLLSQQHEFSHFKGKVQKLFDELLSMIFTDGKCSFLSYNGESFTVWNSLFGIVANRLGNEQISKQMSNAVINCVTDQHISATYPFKEVKDTNVVNVGYTLLFLILQENIDAAIRAANVIAKYPTDYDPYQIAGFKILYTKTGERKFEKRARKILNQFQKFSVKSMTSLIAALTQQAFCHADLATDRKLEVYERQKQTQIFGGNRLGIFPSPTGAFVASESNKQIRLDFSSQNLLALLQLRQSLSSENITCI